MRHPFLPDLSDKSLEDLQKTISDLMGKATFAYRTNNVNMINQLNMVIESYREEYAKKMDEMIKKQNIQTKIQITKE